MMKKGVFFALLIILCSDAGAQEAFTEYQVMPLGGRLQFDQVLETQLNLPEILLTKYFNEEVKVNFSIDSAGNATDLQIEGTKNNVVRSEIARIMRYYRFSKTSLNLSRSQPYFMVFSLSTKEYKHYLKQKSRAKIDLPVNCDTSLAVVSRADRSPSYYKNDDTGLAEYILSEIEYPPVAQERSVEGTVVLEFVVETNGFVTDIEVKKPVGAGCTEEAIRLIRSTRWQPALLNQKAVRYKMHYPITFSLRSARNDQPGTVGN